MLKITQSECGQNNRGFLMVKQPKGSIELPVVLSSSFDPLILWLRQPQNMGCLSCNVSTQNFGLF